MLEAKDQGHNADVFSKNKNKKDLRSKKFANFQKHTGDLQKKKNGFCSKIRRFYGALRDEKALHMTLAHFQQIKRYCYPRAEDRAFSSGVTKKLKIINRLVFQSTALF